MKYIEVIVLINILIHISFIRLSNFVMRRKNNWITIVLSCLLDGIYVVLYLLMPEHVEFLKYLMILILSILPFIGRSLTTTLFNTIIYLMFNFILGGFSGLMIKIINHSLVVIICLIVINLAFGFYSIYRRFHINDKKNLYDIIIIDSNKTFYMKGFYDTGNMLVTDNNIPIIFLNKKYKIGKYYKKITINTISGSNEIELFKIDCLRIKINEKYIKKDVYISYSDISWDVLFGSDLLGG